MSNSASGVRLSNKWQFSQLNPCGSWLKCFLIGGYCGNWTCPLQNLDHNRDSSSFLGGALSAQWHGCCLWWQYLLTKQRNSRYGVASADTNTVLPTRQQVSATLAPACHWKNKVPTRKESEGVGSPGLVVVQLLPFAQTWAPELTNLSFKIYLAGHQLLGSCSPHEVPASEWQKDNFRPSLQVCWNTKEDPNLVTKIKSVVVMASRDDKGEKEKVAQLFAQHVS